MLTPGSITAFSRSPILSGISDAPRRVSHRRAKKHNEKSTNLWQNPASNRRNNLFQINSVTRAEAADGFNRQLCRKLNRQIGLCFDSALGISCWTQYVEIESVA